MTTISEQSAVRSPEPRGKQSIEPREDARPMVRSVDYGSAFWLTYWLAVVFCVGKLFDMGWPRSTAGDRWRYAKDFAAVTLRDLLVAIGVGVVGQLLLLMVKRWPRVQRAAWWGLLCICAFLVVYTTVSVRIYSYLHAFLTYSLLYVAGDFGNMRSSLGVFVTWRFGAVLVGVPVAYWLAVRECSRWIGVPRGVIVVAGTAVLGVVLLAQVAYSETEYWAWYKRPDHQVYENPQWLMIESLVTQWHGSGAVRLTCGYPASDATDFMTASESPHLRSNGFASSGLANAAAILKPLKNVIMFVLESTSTQHMSVYGSPFRTTPRLEAEAAHSLVYDSLYSQDGMTASSLVAITLSQYPQISFRQGTIEHADMPGTSLAQVLHSHGYRTAFITSADIDFSGQDKFLAHRGYDKIQDWHTLSGPKLNSWGSADSALVDTMFNWIDQSHGQPFFLTGWTTQTHHPYQLSPEQHEIDLCHGKLPVEGDGLNRYMNCIAEDDRQIGRLLDGLRSRGLADDTLVIITGDHGEGFGWPHEVMGHGFACYQECVHVPCIFWNPRLFSPGKRLHTVGGHIDLGPSVLDILNIPAPTDWQGRSLFDPGRTNRAYFFAASHDYLIGLRQGNFKYVYDATTGGEELYDLVADPMEQTNIALGQTARCGELRQRITAWIDYEQKHLTESTAPTAQ